METILPYFTCMHVATVGENPRVQEAEEKYGTYNVIFPWQRPRPAVHYLMLCAGLQTIRRRKPLRLFDMVQSVVVKICQKILNRHAQSKRNIALFGWK